MTPEYGVFVPNNQVGAFEKMLSKLEGVRVNPSEEKKREMFEAHLVRYRERVVEVMKEGRDASEVRDRYVDFLYAQYPPYRRLNTPMSGESVNQLIDLVIEIFSDCLTEQPKGIRKGTGMGIWTYWSGIIRPWQAEAMMLRFGLDNGKSRKFEEVERIMGRSASGLVQAGLGNMRSRDKNGNKLDDFLASVELQT